MARPTSDEPFDRLLRRTLERDAPAGAVCPDFEQLAAFLEGGLPPSEAHDVERHASSCPRCAAVLATTLASDTAASPPPVPAPPFWRRWRWAIPLATAATVVGLWVATSDPLQRTQAPVPAAEPFDAVSPQAEAVPEERLAVGERVAPAPSEAPRADDTRSLAAAGQGLPPAPVAEGPPQSISPPAAA